MELLLDGYLSLLFQKSELFNFVDQFHGIFNANFFNRFARCVSTVLRTNKQFVSHFLTRQSLEKSA